VFRRIKSGELGSYNKLRSFVDGLIACEQQEAIFALQEMTLEEKQAVSRFEAFMRGIEGQPLFSPFYLSGKYMTRRKCRPITSVDEPFCRF